MVSGGGAWGVRVVQLEPFLDRFEISRASGVVILPWDQETGSRSRAGDADGSGGAAFSLDANCASREVGPKLAMGRWRSVLPS